MSRTTRAFLRFGMALIASATVVVARVRAAPDLPRQSGPGFSFTPLRVPANGKVGFTLLHSPHTGINFSNRLGNATVANNRLYEIGSGVALGDADGDGWVDIYFCRLEGDNVLYRNLGDWKFEDITARAGVACPNQFSTGCVFADTDGDGDLDLLVNSLGGGTRAFLNDGRAHFTEMTDGWLVRRFGATSLALADVDGDADLDLYVTNYRTDTFHDQLPGLKIETRRQADGTLGLEPRDRFVGLSTRTGGLEVVERGEPDFLYINRGAGRFSPARWDVGVFLDEEGRPMPGPTTDWGLSVLFRDLNHDGRPDLYVCNDFVYWPDRVWLNQEGQRFRAAPRHAFRSTSLSSMAVDVADINRDGFDDIFVADMLSPRREFRAWQRPDTLEGTVAWPLADPNFRPEVTRNTLHLARGDGTYAEIARLAGVSATDWSWGLAFLDVDLDGWEDLLIATGNNHDVQDMDVMPEIARSGGWKTSEARRKSLAKVPRRDTPGVALRNRRDLTFEDVSAAWGFNAVGIAHGLALADLDRDGDLDVVLNCLNAPARILSNNSPAPRLAVRLKGQGQNTRGIGARIKIKGGPVQQTQEMIAGGRYCSGDDAMRVFAAGETKQLEIEIIWRSGKQSIVKDAKPNRLYEIAEAAAIEAQSPESKVQSLESANRQNREGRSTLDKSSARNVAKMPQALFQDISAKLGHVHEDEPFDDFARQPLLPRKLSTLGPGVCCADLDRDGDDDLLLGAGKDGRLTVFRNDGAGGLKEWTNAFVPKVASRDQTTVLVWHGADGITRVLAGESNWEDADTNAPPFHVYAFQPGVFTHHASPFVSHRSSTGPMAFADVDGDGDLDLFVGGRVTAGRYPEPATSHLLRSEGGEFRIAQSFPDLGLVSGAVFTDFDGDGDPDLALACEWAPIRLFRNDTGRFAEWIPALLWPDAPSPTPLLRLSTAPAGQIATLNLLTGWWNGIAAGDFDGDGRLDLVASNWGRNWRTDQPTGLDIPVRLVYGDFAGDGIIQTILASIEPGLAKVTPWRERKVVAAAIPTVAERFPTHRAYGRASVSEILGDSAGIARELQATTTDSMVFLNRGDFFEARPFPVEAQFAPAFGVSVADFDGDGNEDAFLAQNFFGVDAETSRHDAGTGLALLGDGRGGFRALQPAESGIALYAEQRGCAVADFDADGRTDLVVAQHRGPTGLFRNVGGTSGVRLALRGPKENPGAVGALARLKFGDRLGPAREIHAGSGYWAQDSATLVLSAPTPPSALRIHWPGGKTQEWPWPAGLKSAEISTEGVRPR